MIPQHYVLLYPCCYTFLEFRRRIGRIEVNDNIDVQRQNAAMFLVKI